MGSESRDCCGIIRFLLTPWWMRIPTLLSLLLPLYICILPYSNFNVHGRFRTFPAHSSCAGRLDFCAIGSKNHMNIIIWGLQSRGSVISVDCIFYYIIVFNRIPPNLFQTFHSHPLRWNGWARRWLWIDDPAKLNPNQVGATRKASKPGCIFLALPLIFCIR